MKVISHLFHVLYQILKKLYRTYTLCGAIDADNQGIVLIFLISHAADFITKFRFPHFITIHLTLQLITEILMKRPEKKSKCWLMISLFYF